MCSAEDDLRIAERDIAWLEGQIEEICDLVDDAERGILALPELRREIGAVRERSRRQAVMYR